MRDLIIEEIEQLRKRDGFAKNTMRWARWYLGKSGVQYYTRKQAKRDGAVHLSDTTVNGFKTLEDKYLLFSYRLLIIISHKQM